MDQSTANHPTPASSAGSGRTDEPFYEAHFACLTGDCPHETQAECDAAIRAEMVRLYADHDRLTAALSEAQAERDRVLDSMASPLGPLSVTDDELRGILGYVGHSGSGTESERRLAANIVGERAYRRIADSAIAEYRALLKTVCDGLSIGVEDVMRDEQKLSAALTAKDDELAGLREAETELLEMRVQIRAADYLAGAVDRLIREARLNAIIP